MRHSCVLAAQFVQGVSANGGTNSSDTANMVGMTVRADRAEYAHLGMRGADMLHKTLAIPRRIDD